MNILATECPKLSILALAELELKDNDVIGLARGTCKNLKMLNLTGKTGFSSGRRRQL